MPIYKIIDTGRERGQIWRREKIGVERYDYPDSFDDALWVYAQSERDAGEKDLLAWVTWYSSKTEYKSELTISISPSVTWADNTPPPSKSISAEKIGEFKNKLLATLNGHSHEKLLKNYVNEIMTKTRVTSRMIGKAKAKTNPLVQEVMEKINIDEKVPD